MNDFDPDEDIDALLASELTGFDPDSRYGASTPIGGDVTDWHTLPDGDAKDVWETLRGWVEWVTVRYSIPISVVPNCWYKHGALVEELAALHTAHRAAFDPADAGFGPIGWHERLHLALPRLTRAYGGGCSTEHRPTKPRSWETATDEQDWETWTAQAHAHRP